MRAVATRPLLSVAGRQYDVADALLGAHQRGEWAALEHATAATLACERRLAADPAAVDPDDVRAAAREFRYERDLIADDELEAWLRHWALDAGGWDGWIRASVLRTREPEAVERLVGADPPTTGTEAAAAWREVVCSGALGAFARALAARAVAFAADGGDQEASVGAPRAAGGELSLPPGLAGMVDAGKARARLERLSALERAYARFRTGRLDPRAAAAAIAAHQLDWLRVDCRTLAFANDDMAREAVLCVRDDGMALEEVARAAGVAVERRRPYLDEVEPALREQLLSAAPGELLGPLRDGGRFRVLTVAEKESPSSDDPEIRRRAEQAVLDRAVAAAGADRLHWHERL